MGSKMEHRNAVQVHMVTGRVPRHTLAPEGCPATYDQRNVQAHMNTGLVPGSIWVLEQCLDTYGHRNGAQSHIGNRRVPDTYAHRKGAPAHMDTVMVPDHIGTKMVPGLLLALEGCPGSYGNRNGALVNMETGIQLRHI